MAYKKISLTENHIKLIQNLKFESFTFDGESRTGRFAWGIDQYSPWGGSYPIEDIARILGHWQDYIEGTENNPLGRRYPEDMEEEFLHYYHDIIDNMEYILSLITQYSGEGGLKVGTYKCNPRFKEWTYIND